MVLYHGTVKTFLGSILKEGLKPVKENRWQANWYGPANHDVIANDEEEVVYLTPLKEAAQEFARNKARYLRALPGKKFRFGPKFLRKLPDAPVIHTEPVVLKIEFDNQNPKFVHSMDIDKRGIFFLGMQYPGTIEPNFITVEE